MAIYSCNLKSIGRSTHQAGTAGAHIRYISRPEAEPEILARHIPEQPGEARNWLDRRERALRKNARVIDKIRIALPRELDEAQRANLVRDFMFELTGDRIPWFAAIHQQGKDGHNPHAHIAIHDRDTETGQRILRLSDNARDRIKAGLPGPKAVEWVRERWEVACNAALERAGIDKRVDRRTLEAQGIDRLATIHEGPRAQHIEGTVKRPKSRERINGCGRVIDYPSIDKGRTRREFNAHIIDLNLDRAARSPNRLTVVWAQFEKEQRAKDQALEKKLAGEARALTSDHRNASLVYLSRINRMRSERNLKARSAERRIREKFEALRNALRERHQKEWLELKDRQSRLHMRIFRILDITGKTRRRHEEARKALSGDHRGERSELSARFKVMKSAARAGVKARYKADIAAQYKKRLQHLAQIEAKRKQSENFADIERQRREADRELMRRLTEQKIEKWKDREDGGQKVVASDFAQALLTAAKRDAQRNDKDKKKDFDRSL